MPDLDSAKLCFGHTQCARIKNHHEKIRQFIVVFRQASYIEATWITIFTCEGKEMSHPDPDKVIREIWRPDGRGRIPPMYAIVDAARNESIYPEIMDYSGEHVCLYQGNIPEVLAKAAHHLVRLQQRSPFTKWLITEGWGDSWGVFLESSADMRRLKEHFVGMNMAKDEEGNEFFFRYYDPRVLRAYLPTCNQTEATIFFGPARSFVMEDEDAGTMIKYSRESTGWNYETISLS